MTNLFISLYPFYFIILAAKTATQITNTDIILPNLKTRLCIQIILVRRKQRRLNGKYVYIIISFLLHYSGCQNRHANYKHNTSNLKTRLCYLIRVPQKQRRLNDESVYIARFRSISSCSKLIKLTFCRSLLADDGRFLSCWRRNRFSAACLC